MDVDGVGLGDAAAAAGVVDEVGEADALGADDALGTDDALGPADEVVEGVTDAVEVVEGVGVAVAVEVVLEEGDGDGRGSRHVFVNTGSHPQSEPTVAGIGSVAL